MLSTTDRSRSNSAESGALVPQLFKRTEVIGRGKFGVVYKAHHVKTKQVYAIKVLNLDSPEDEVEDVQKEIQFLSSLKQTPNITHYYGSYLSGTKLWVIMEYCAGGSLRTLLRPGKIDEKYLGVILREILIALVPIHKDNVIHRDIKAANVLITNDGHVKLCDFGVAAQLSTANHKRQTMAGTPYWMAPEVIMEGVYYNTKADIWSLGITAYEIATGNPPYCDVEALRAMQLVTKSKPARLEGRNYSPLLKEFIALCLDEDPEARPSAEELLMTKFIKAYKGISVVILKELISRYLLYSEKHKSREGVMINLDDDEQSKSNYSGAYSGNGDTQVEMKWDFDLLKSNEYILQNDINVDAIPEESDWGRSHSEVNYAYPDEDIYYHSNKPQYFQGTTMGKTIGDPTVNDSTIQAYYQQHPTGTPTTGNYQSKSNFTLSQSAKTETKASKQLLQLFEDNEKIHEEEERGFPHLGKSLSTLHINENDSSSTALGHNVQRQDILLNGSAYHSQSTPILPVLQTGTKPGASNVPLTSTPAAVEIEIPEELPVTTSLAGTSAISHGPTSSDQPNIKVLQRSSTSNSLPGAVISRRPPLNGVVSAVSRADSGGVLTSNSAITHDSRNIISHSLSSVGSHNSSIATGSTTLDGSLSPSWGNSNQNMSPEKTAASGYNGADVISGNQMQGLPPGKHNSNKAQHATNNSLEGGSQQVGNNNQVSMFLSHSVGHLGSSALLSGGNGQPPTATDKDYNISERASREFKRNNPNLKLQMPSPTIVFPNKLLNSAPMDEQAYHALTAGSTGTNSNINQFGINTSSTTNIPVAMTPLSEKVNLDFVSKLKRSGSTSNRANTGPTPFTELNIPSSAAQAPLSSAPNSSSLVTASTASGASSSTVPTTNSSMVAQHSQHTVITTAANNNCISPSTLVTTTGATISSSMHMEVPPRMLPMDMFIDVDEIEDSHRIDRKPLVLRELENLLRMLEDSLPVMENALKATLPTHTTLANDDD